LGKRRPSKASVKSQRKANVRIFRVMEKISRVTRTTEMTRRE
jgi:hypothetical protein